MNYKKQENNNYSESKKEEYYVQKLPITSSEKTGILEAWIENSDI